MNENSLVSIVIPCFNYGHFIGQTIASVERCDPRLYELIIVNDGSDDPHTQTVLRKLEADGYRVINQENRGVSAARNTGIAAAKGKYILPLDADDEIYPIYLESAVKLLEENPKLGVVYGRAEFFGAQTGEWKLPPFDVGTLLIHNFIYISAVYRRHIWEDCGGYNAEMDEWEDWDFWISVAERGWDFVQLDETVFRYRIHENSKMHQHRVRGEVSPAVQQLVMYRHAAFYRTHFIEMYNAANQLKHWENHPLRGIARLISNQFRK